MTVLQLQECAIQLWNWAVTKNLGTTVNNDQKAKGTFIHNTHTMLVYEIHWQHQGIKVEIITVFIFTVFAVRHVACCLLYCCEPENPTEGIIRKQILVRDMANIFCVRNTGGGLFVRDVSLQMASRTGRAWLECKNPQMADNFLRRAVKVKKNIQYQTESTNSIGCPHIHLNMQ